MTDLFRILVVVFLAMHGIGHLSSGSWPRGRRCVSGFGAGPLDPAGRRHHPAARWARLWGIVALVVMRRSSWPPRWPSWPARCSGAPSPTAGVILSFGVVVPWARQAPGWTAINAIVADLLLMILIALPLSVDMVTGA